MKTDGLFWAMRYIGGTRIAFLLEMFCSYVFAKSSVSKAYDQINAKIADVSEVLANAPMKKPLLRKKNYSWYRKFAVVSGDGT
ncbi:hypothetical protein TNIN_391041 [Trichonephila inaurata madagascariensis]|uniref:Uncharacterized protein n=1 Tax=Trichonephila inaurata madagascariensis TaxID=2747483 RepID=A0A8X7CUT2_9ARAC|nr:hypothetical protein TNIN_391041 [Trichonephila inaurata madagascariensis]